MSRCCKDMRRIIKRLTGQDNHDHHHRRKGEEDREGIRHQEQEPNDIDKKTRPTTSIYDIVHHRSHQYLRHFTKTGFLFICLCLPLFLISPFLASPFFTFSFFACLLSFSFFLPSCFSCQFLGFAFCCFLFAFSFKMFFRFCFSACCLVLF